MSALNPPKSWRPVWGRRPAGAPSPSPRLVDALAGRPDSENLRFLTEGNAAAQIIWFHRP
jgi:hypothetical protein